jgi:site-specific DNA-methyltransferase (adenine-specific)
MKISDIKINPKNPRIIKDDRFKKLVKSIEEFPKMMVLRPIITDDEGIVLGGNMRLKAIKELGYKEIPDDWVKKACDLTDEERKRFIIEDNVAFGEWDWETLANEWSRNDLTEWGIEIPDFAFKQEAHEDDYEIPEEIKTDIITGDLFEIAEHRLLCGDSTKIEDVRKLMNGHKADLLFTDPPYGVSYGDKNKYLNAISPGNRIQENISNDTLDKDGMCELWRNAFINVKKILSEKASYYVCSVQGGDLGLMMMMMMMEAGIPARHTIIWVKNNHVLSRVDYMYKHEPILYGWTKTHKFYRRGEFNTSVWNIDKPLVSDLHPTMKPVKLVSNALNNSTDEGDLVYDAFMGSGTTMVSAHQLNRKCYGMEIDPKYCQIIIDRMKKLDPGIVIKKNGNELKMN